MTLTPSQKEALFTELISPANSPALNCLIRYVIEQAQTLADVHYALSVCSQALKAANGKVAERMEKN